jgi:hypothetical protein
MVDTGFSSFDTMVDKANRLLKDVEEAFEWPKERRKQSYAALRTVLHPLRDRLPVETAGDHERGSARRAGLRRPGLPTPRSRVIAERVDRRQSGGAGHHRAQASGSIRR